MSAALIELLRQHRYAATAEEIADIVWLLLHMGAQTDQRSASEQPAGERRPAGAAAAPGGAVRPPAAPAPAPPGGAPVHRDDGSGAAAGAQTLGLPVTLAGGAALAQQRLLARALRPLMRRLAAPLRSVLDEDASAQASAEWQMCWPVTRPQLERRWEVALVVDDAPSMQVWRQTVAEWQRLLEHHGAFRYVRLWSIETDERARVRLRAGWGAAASPPRHPRELLSPSGHQIILVLSDTVAPAWQDRGMTDLLREWSRRAAVTILHMLPPPFWHRTALRRYEEHSLSVRPTAQGAPEHAEVLVPVVHLRPRALQQWAALLDGADAEVPAVAVARDAPAIAAALAEALDGPARVRRFRQAASPPAWRLAQAFASIPLSFPLMQLVQRLTDPQAAPEHIAEVLLGGLVRRTPAAHQPAADTAPFDFYPGAREELLQGLAVADRAALLRAVSEALMASSGRPFRFRAMLLDPDGADYEQLCKANPAFAALSTTVLRGMGRAYAQLAERLERRAALPEQAPEPLPGATPDPAPAARPEPPASTSVPMAPNLGAMGIFHAPVTIVNTAPTPALHQLRAPVPDFTGREDVLARLVAALRPEMRGRAAAICGVRGMPGMGKTELAFAAAAQLQPDYPDGQLLIDLRGSTETRLSPQQALQRIISAFRPDEQLPDDLPALQALYRSLLAGKRVLILADDASDAAQVRPLQPPVASALLITSRLRFTLDGMAVVDLDRLSEQEAIQLVQGICGRLDDTQAHLLAQLCGHLPLALRISAGILANNPALPVERYLVQLVDERQRLAQFRDPDDPYRDMEATLYLSYAALDQITQTRFRRLGVLAADADLNLIAGLLGLKEAEAETLLLLLLRRSLIEYDAARGRWGMHELVRVFALGRLQPREEQNVRLSYARRVIRLMEQADQRYLQGGQGLLEGLALFDRERAHLEAVRSWLWQQPPTFATDTLCCDEAIATVKLGELRDPARGVRIPQWERVAAIARRRGDGRQEAVALGNLGNAYAALGEMRAAIGCLEQTLAIMRRHGNRAGEARAFGNLGSFYAALGETHTAITYYEQDLAIVRELGDRRDESAALGNLGSAHAALGETRTALAHHEQQLAIARKLGDRRGEGVALGYLGSAYAALGDIRTAISYHEQDLAIARELGDRRDEGAALGHLGSAYADLGDMNTAISYHEQDLAIARELGDRRGESAALGNLGSAYTTLGDIRTAIAYLEQHLAIARELGDRRGEADALAHLGAAHVRLRDAPSAVTSYEAALRLAREVGDQHLEGRILGNLGMAYERLDQYTQAATCYQRSLTILESIGYQSDAARTRWAYGQLLVKQGQRERGLTLLAECLAYERQIDHAQADEHAAQLERLVSGDLQMLEQQRANVQTLLQQIAAQDGRAYASIATLNTLVEARAQIARRKAALRAWGISVEDSPSDEDKDDRSAIVDVLLVTTTIVEIRAVFDALKTQTGHTPARRFLGNTTYYDLGDVGGARVGLVRSETSAVMVGGALTATAVLGAIGELRPATVVMVGLAFGNDPARQQVGDILVAKQIRLCEPQRVGDDPDNLPRLIPRGHSASTSPRLLDRCRDGALRWPPEQGRVYFGLVLSGERLLDQPASVAELLAREPEAIGGELEGAGLYAAAVHHKVDWISIKAICDWADSNHVDDKDARQALAARNAATFALAVLAAGGFAHGAIDDEYI